MMLASVGKLKSPRRVIAAGGGGQFLKSQGLTGAQGFALNTRTVTKDMYSQSGTRNVPSGYNPKSPAGSLTPSNQSETTFRTVWNDWGNDYFDAWGDFYIFNPADQTASYIELPGAGRASAPSGHQNQADESFFTETQTHHSKTFKIIHGWATQGIFKLDVACTSDETFQFALGHYGNMGSDGGTVNTDQTHTASWGTLHFNFNKDAIPFEFFYTHVIPKKKADNDTINTDTTGLFTAVSGNDNLAIWTGAFTHGFTCYYIKGSNASTGSASTHGSMAAWVANDIALSATYHD